MAPENAYGVISSVRMIKEDDRQDCTSNLYFKVNASKKYK